MLFRYGIDAPHTVRNYFCYFLCVVAVCAVYCKYAPKLFKRFCLLLRFVLSVVSRAMSAISSGRDTVWQCGCQV